MYWYTYNNNNKLITYFLTLRIRTFGGQRTGEQYKTILKYFYTGERYALSYVSKISLYFTLSTK